MNWYGNANKKWGVFQLKYPLTDKWLKTIRRIYNSAKRKKEWMNRPCGHCAKWDKSNRKRPILYGITYAWNLKKPNS